MAIGPPDLLPPLPVVSGKGAAVLSSGGRQASAIARELDRTATVLREHRAALSDEREDLASDPRAAPAQTAEGASPTRGGTVDILA